MKLRASIIGYLLVAMLTPTITRGQQTSDSLVLAQPAEDQDDIPLTKLALDPAFEPEPALRYNLVRPQNDRTPGNASPCYYRAMLLHSQLSSDVQEQYNERREQWTTVPLDQLPKKEIRKWLQSYHSTLFELRKATNREYCDWDMRLQDLGGMELIAVLLPEFQEMRSLARILQVKLRLEIAERRYDDAVETLQMGYQLALDTAQPPLLVNGLIGLAIAAVMNKELLELIDSPGAPNMYWALAKLDRPLIDMRPAMRFEMALPEKIFPFLKDAETAQRTPERWREMIVESLRKLSTLGGPPYAVITGENWQLELAATAFVIKAYPDAKRSLIEEGMSGERVKAMPAAQVVAIAASRAYRHIYHEMFKWSLLPYWQAHQRMALADKQLEEDGYLKHEAFSRQIIPIASLLMPAVNAAAKAPIRQERDLAALQTIEALRMHAAAHDGRLPKTLAEIDAVVVPMNPATGKLFPYRLEGDVAHLDLPSPSGPGFKHNAKRYQITITPAKPTAP